MRHRLGYKKLNRTSEHRKALIKNMLNNLIKYEQIYVSFYIDSSSFFDNSAMLSGGQLGISIPKYNDIPVKTSLISFNDFLPKFGVLNISPSDFWTKSPM